MSKTSPLEGIRVLDLTVALAGPYGSMLMGGLGAEVIRIETPGGGDIARTNPPFVGATGLHFDASGPDDVSLTVLNRARNKKSITLDLKSEKGREIFFRLVDESDVIIQNMSEGTVARLGVDYETVKQRNPGIVYASISAFGDPSVCPGLKGMDIIVQALSGVMGATGFADGPPVRFGLPIADMVAPMYAVQGILAALIYRGRSGEGQHIEVSMLDCLASWVAEEHFDIFDQFGYEIRTGNFQDRLVPFGIYPASDGHVAIAGFNPSWLKGLLDVLGRPELLEDPRFTHRGPRMKNADVLNRIIEEWTRQHTTQEIVDELFVKRQVPAAPVRSPLEVLQDEKLRERGAVVELEHPTLGKIGATGMGLPIRFSANKAAFDVPAGALGSANDEIYKGLLKLSDSDVASLRNDGVI